MKQLCITGVSSCILVMSGLQLVSAEEDHPLTSNIMVGVLVIESGDNISPGSSSDTIKDLDHAAKQESFFAPLLVPNLTYDLGEPGGASLFFNIDPPVDEIGSLGVNIGVTQDIKTMGNVEYSIFFSPFAAAYKNPYLTGVKRETTSAIQYGAKISLNSIMETGLGIDFSWMNDSIDNDQLAKIQPTLARDGNIYSFNPNYSFSFIEKMTITPKTNIRFGDYDGESNNYIEVEYGVEVSYTIGDLTIAPDFYYSTSDYAKANPIFNKKRDDKGYGANFVLHYAGLFGNENLALITYVGYSKDDSNITFYDTEAITTGVMLSYDYTY